MTSASSHSADYWPLELLTPLRTITCLFRGYSLSFLPVGRLVFVCFCVACFCLSFGDLSPMAQPSTVAGFPLACHAEAYASPARTEVMSILQTQPDAKEWSERDERHGRYSREVAVERSGRCRHTSLR